MSAPDKTGAHEVRIDGVLYVPATEAVASVDVVMQAMYESYMGEGTSWRDNPYQLWISVNEDGEGESFEEIAARVAILLSPKSEGK